MCFSECFPSYASLHIRFKTVASAMQARKIESVIKLKVNNCFQFFQFGNVSRQDAHETVLRIILTSETRKRQTVRQDLKKE